MIPANSRYRGLGRHRRLSPRRRHRLEKLRPAGVLRPARLSRRRPARGRSQVRCATDIFLRLRSTATAHDIAWFEYASYLAASSLRRVLEAVRVGATDFEMLSASAYDGFPLSVHMTLKTGDNRISLASARGERACLGDRFSCGIGLRGANCCRVGWIARRAADLPAAARDYAEAYAGPYLQAMAAWFSALHLESTGADLHDAIQTGSPSF